MTRELAALTRRTRVCPPADLHRPCGRVVEPVISSKRLLPRFGPSTPTIAGRQMQGACQQNSVRSPTDSFDFLRSVEWAQLGHRESPPPEQSRALHGRRATARPDLGRQCRDPARLHYRHVKAHRLAARHQYRHLRSSVSSLLGCPVRLSRQPWLGSSIHDPGCQAMRADRTLFISPRKDFVSRSSRTKRAENFHSLSDRPRGTSCSLAIVQLRMTGGSAHAVFRHPPTPARAICVCSGLDMRRQSGSSLARGSEADYDRSVVVLPAGRTKEATTSPASTAKIRRTTCVRRKKSMPSNSNIMRSSQIAASNHGSSRNSAVVPCAITAP